MTLIQRNAEQLRRVALENSKNKQNKNVKSVQSKIYNSNPFTSDFYNIRNIKNSNAHKVSEQYLDQDVALKEFEDMLENYRLYRLKDPILEKQKLTLSRDHDAFTIRNTAQLVDMIAEEILTRYDIK